MCRWQTCGGEGSSAAQPTSPPPCTQPGGGDREDFRGWHGEWSHSRVAVREEAVCTHVQPSPSTQPSRADQEDFAAAQRGV
eukprot:1161671-Pelagomonas_calceolata.AAC.26